MWKAKTVLDKLEKNIMRHKNKYFKRNGMFFFLGNTKKEIVEILI